MQAEQLFGRDAEWNELAAAIDELPRSALFVIEGEPGIGKSALIEALARHATARGLVVARWTGDELGGPNAGANALDPAEDSLHWLDGAAERLGREPILVLVDDLQWAPPDMLRMLGGAVRRFVEGGSVAVFATRSGPRHVEVETLFDRLTALGANHVKLRPLDQAAVRAMATAVLAAPVTPQLTERLAGAAGNPLYLHTLLAEARVGGRRGERSAATTDDVPAAAYRALIRQRVAALGADGMHVLRVAAVFGRTFRISDVVQLSSVPEPAALRIVTDAVDAELLEPHHDELAFRHDLVRETLYYGLPVAIRQQLHRGVLALLDAQRTPPGRRIPHAVRMNLGADDLAWILALVDQAPWHDRLALLRRAGELPLSPAAAQHVSVLQVSALVWTGEPQAAIAAADDLLNSPLPDALSVALQDARAVALMALGRSREAVERRIMLAPDADPVLRAAEAASLAFACSNVRDFERAKRLAHAALRLGAEHLTGERLTEVTARVTLAWAARCEGRTVDSLAALRPLLGTPNSGAAGGAQIGPNLFAGLTHQAAADHPAALESVRRDEQAGDDLSTVIRVPFRHLVRAIAHLDGGAWDDASTELEIAADSAAEFQVGMVVEWVRALNDVLTLYRYGPALLERLHIDSNRDARLAPEWTMLRNLLAADMRGDTSAAFGIVDALLHPAAPDADHVTLTVCAPVIARLVLARGADGDRDRLAGVVDRLLDRDDPAGHVAARWARCITERDAGRLADLAAELPASRAATSAFMRDDVARMLATRGDPEARTVAGRVLDQYDSMGAVALAGRLRGALRRHGVRIRRGAASRRARPASGWEAVTPTERRVVALVAEGLSNAEIAERLIVSRRTIESHLVHVYQKVGMRSRLELVRHVLTSPHELSELARERVP